jgi:hypothetical protein
MKTENERISKSKYKQTRKQTHDHHYFDWTMSMTVEVPSSILSFSCSSSLSLILFFFKFPFCKETATIIKLNFVETARFVHVYQYKINKEYRTSSRRAKVNSFFSSFSLFSSISTVTNNNYLRSETITYE